MRGFLHIALLSGLIAGCSSSAPKDGSRASDQIAPLDTVKHPVGRPAAALGKQLHAYWDTANGSGVYCEDTTLYSMDFVRCLRGMGLPNLLEIRDGAIYGESPDPIRMDPVLSDKSTHHFSTPKGHVTLVVRRFDFTRIEARLSSRDGGDQNDCEGTLVRGCDFILGAQSDDGENGAYFVDEYWSSDDSVSIRIGMDGDRLAATISLLALDGQKSAYVRLYEVL